MIRKATENDAEQLAALNDEFNGPGETTTENITRTARRLMMNRRAACVRTERI